jgi:hypothetical protein
LIPINDRQNEARALVQFKLFANGTLNNLPLRGQQFRTLGLQTNTPFLVPERYFKVDEGYVWGTKFEVTTAMTSTLHGIR